MLLRRPLISRTVFFVALGAMALSAFCGSSAQEDAASDLPKVVIVGDSIRLSYAPTVIEQLAGKATVVSPKANGGDSSNVLRHLAQWVIDQRPAVVHFNCGIHDTKRFKTSGEFQVSPQQYEANLREIVGRIRKETGAVVLFATTTPILDDRAARVRADRDYELLDASVCRYNAIATKVMQELNVPVNDLYSLLTDPQLPLKTADLIGGDGVHMQPQAKEQLGKAVAAFIRSHLPGRP